ncbi:MAG TPA: hypothetical protein VKE27_01215, partial [Candidatus Dormibacteraeota bacterium]|nr:hypothetical protein [Candidatus Dormibacteraeota bacterium]
AAIGPGLAPNLPVLIASFFAVGFLWAFVDVLDNALGAGLERTRQTHLINGFHGFWSLGAFGGSLVAGAAAAVGVAPLFQFVITGVLLAIAALWLLRGLPGLSAAAATPTPIPRSVTAAVVALAAMSFAGIIAESGTSDWSALFLRELAHASPGLAAAGFSAFSVAAMLVRFRADRLTARAGRTTVARIGAATAVCGLALAIALPSLPTAILGFALVGMGTAVVLPLAFAAGANLGRTGTSLAVVMASTYLGYIAGPPLIGALADRLGLRIAMAIPLVAAVVVLTLAGSLATGWASPAPEAELAAGRG